MSFNQPGGNDKKNRNEPFGDLMRSMNVFFNESSGKGILRSIDDFFQRPLLHSSFIIQVQETDNEHIVTAELPGIKREQIDLDIYDRHIKITVKKQDILTEEHDRNQTYRRRESMQTMSRTVAFTHPINERNVRASYRDGLLEIRIPKRKGKKVTILEDE
ncbi:Hsp20/alpha crystallin family protein [Mesobacillus harenae]|uniref:Hsp20/alpha crystallin family protein n=1 Tax=Mesobacillus harenae TaxID=2213203 RepID=UPI00157FC452|nr:Hsp20/alpha crystallin family protein [Mesobacillus harenae]